MRESVTPFLQPGEAVQVVFSAQARNPVSAALAEEFGRGTGDRGKWRRAARVCAAGPPVGLLMHVRQVEGERLRVIRRFYKDISTADSLAGIDR